jgi:hypothetical protein
VTANGELHAAWKKQIATTPKIVKRQKKLVMRQKNGKEPTKIVTKKIVKRQKK